MSLLAIDNLCIDYPGRDGALRVVDDLTLQIHAGEAVALVGETGSGKTQTALSILGLLPQQAQVSGSIKFVGKQLLGADDRELREVRGMRIGMVFQDPLTAMNPYRTVGAQIGGILREHGSSRNESQERCLSMLDAVGLPDPAAQANRYPHQLSGGMRQRAMLAAALIGSPQLLIADEPTTSLDVTVQAQILALLKSLREKFDTALLLISHDLGVVAGNSNRMIVLQHGKTQEAGDTTAVFAAPASAYTQKMLRVSPRLQDVPQTQSVTPAAAVLEAQSIEVIYQVDSRRWLSRPQAVPAVRNISLTVGKGETLAIVGESGSGKSSLARAILGLVPTQQGRLQLLGETAGNPIARRSLPQRRAMQMVFQDPIASLNPQHTVQHIVSEPLLIHRPEMREAERNETSLAMLQQVGLTPTSEISRRLPHELSGGQAQRVAIARALILKPAVLVCDEAVSSLDASVRKDILALLQDEQRATGLSLLFIAHDLAVVRQISHRIVVMYLGQIVEMADNTTLFRRPRHPYTAALLDSVPIPDPIAEAARPLVALSGETPSPTAIPSGCAFHPRCAYAQAQCRESEPPLLEVDQVSVACHRSEELDLTRFASSVG